MRPTQVSIEGTDGIVDLADPASEDAGSAGAKAAALARARRQGLPVLDGFVVTVAAASALTTAATAQALRTRWERLTENGTHAVVVRSSSPVEDGRTQSMAGQFTSVLDVRGWEAFGRAVGAVVGSGQGQPMAVLVQPHLEALWGGVLFGADPVTGRTDRLVVAAVPGGPDRLVSGEVDGTQLALSPRGRIIESHGETPRLLQTARARRELVQLAARAARIFGGPQDIEWAVDGHGRLVLLQSRPITTLGTEVRADGPVLGPGPVAETFPDALSPLEEDLWLAPLRDALREALALTGAAGGRRLRRSPVIVSVGGRAAADLDLLGASPVRRRWITVLDPRPPGRRLRAAWRVGRLRAAFGALASDLLAQVDADLMAVPAPHELTDAQLAGLLRRTRAALVALHGHEILAGQLLGADGDGEGAAAVAALHTLAAARAEDPSAGTDALLARHPVLLALTPPAIGRRVELPASVIIPPGPATGTDGARHRGPGSHREALRLRGRWMHELSARAAERAGEVLARRGALAAPLDIRRARLTDVLAALESGSAVHLTLGVEPTGTPLPAAFRLSVGDVVVPVAADELGLASRGRGAGGGRGAGPVRLGTDSEPPAPGDVLVVSTLDPALAAVLPGLGGLVAETGSVLSHLAIVARELGVPTVVGLAGATERFASGTWVVVDGTSGDVVALDTGEWRAA